MNQVTREIGEGCELDVQLARPTEPDPLLRLQLTGDGHWAVRREAATAVQQVLARQKQG